MTFPGIESNPNVCGGEPCIIRSRLPVWLLEQARRLGTSEAELLQAYPTLSAQDLANAWNYVMYGRILKELTSKFVRTRRCPRNEFRVCESAAVRLRGLRK